MTIKPQHKTYLPHLLLIAATLIVFGGTLAPYPFWDDYGQMIYIMKGWTDWLTTGLSRDGRPMAALLITKGFEYAGSLDQLYILRIPALIGAIGFAILLFYRIKKAGPGTMTAFTITCVVALSPGVGEYVGWTVSWPFMPVLLVIMWLSGHYCDLANEGTPLKKMILNGAWICALLLFSMLFYQSLAGFFVFIPFVYLFCGKRRPALFAAPLLFASFGLYRFVVFPGLNAIYEPWCQPVRTTLTGGLFEHLVYISKHFFVLTASGWTHMCTPPPVWKTIGSVVILLTLYALAYMWKSNLLLKNRHWTLPLALFCIAVSAPQVFLLDDIWAYRTHYPLSALLFASAILGLTHLPKVKGKIRNYACVAICACTIGAGYAVFWNGLVVTSLREHSIVKQSVHKAYNSGKDSVTVIVCPTWPDAQQPGPIKRYSIYGHISLAMMNQYEFMAVEREEIPAGTPSPQIQYVEADKITAQSQDDDSTAIVDLYGDIRGIPTISK